jgi:hypothetical protein
VLLEDTFGAVVDNCVFKALGSSGYHIKLDGTFHTSLRDNIYEFEDAAPDDGKRDEVTVTLAGANPGWSRMGVGAWQPPTFADDNERDTAPAAGRDDARASTAAGGIIYVTSPTTPSSKLQIRVGAAWIGIGEQDGTPI